MTLSQFHTFEVDVVEKITKHLKTLFLAVLFAPFLMMIDKP